MSNPMTRAQTRASIAPSTWTLALFLLLLPVGTALSGIIGNISLLNYVALAYLCLAAAEVFQRKVFVINKGEWAIFAYMGYSLVTSLWNRELHFNYYFTTFALSFLMLLFTTGRRYSGKELDMLRRAILLSTFVVLGATLLNVGNTYAGRIVIELSSVMDPNDFGCGTCILFAALLMEYSRSRKLLPVLGLVGVLGAILLTGSRGALLMSVAELFLWLLLVHKNGRGRGILLFLLLLAALFLMEHRLSAELLSRFSWGSILTSGGSGRTKIWKASLARYFSGKPLPMLFGYGHGSFAQTVNYIGANRDYAYESHNVFINALIEGGLLGFTLLVLSFVQCFRTARRNGNDLGVFALAGFLVAGMTLDVQSYRLFPIAFFVAMVMDNPRFCKDPAGG